MGPICFTWDGLVPITSLQPGVTTRKVYWVLALSMFPLWPCFGTTPFESFESFESLSSAFRCIGQAIFGVLYWYLVLGDPGVIKKDPDGIEVENPPTESLYCRLTQRISTENVQIGPARSSQGGVLRDLYAGSSDSLETLSNLRSMCGTHGPPLYLVE